jgi:hypothetical protein
LNICLARIGQKRNAYKILVKKLERQRLLGRSTSRSWIILKRILNKQDRKVWTDFVLRAIVISGGSVVITTVNFPVP